MAGLLARILIVAVATAGGAAVAAAQEASLDSLLQNSPFGRNPGVARTTSDAPLEFRGVMREGDTDYFSIYEAATSRSTWVRRNEASKQNFEVKDYDPDNKRVTVQYQGSDLVLALASAPSVPVAPTANRPMPAPAVGAAPAPSSEGEAERLRKIAEEIKRRRALRQQAIRDTQSNR